MEYRSTLKYAELGARLRLEQLEEESAQIKAWLQKNGSPAGIVRLKKTDAGWQRVDLATNGRPRRRPMSPDERRAVSKRMKKYWAIRRIAKKITVTSDRR